MPRHVVAPVKDIPPGGRKVVQVNGRVRDRVEVPVGLDEAELLTRAKELPRVRAHVDGKDIRKEIVVPGKLVNFVV